MLDFSITKSEFGVSGRSNFISVVFIIWKEILKEMVLFFANTPFYNLLSLKASLMLLEPRVYFVTGSVTSL